MFIANYQAFAEQFVIKDVHVPYSIRIKEYSSFDMDKPISKDDILPTYNLLYPTYIFLRYTRHSHKTSSYIPYFFHGYPSHLLELSY